MYLLIILVIMPVVDYVGDNASVDFVGSNASC
jgi:hypothetical protein